MSHAIGPWEFVANYIPGELHSHGVFANSAPPGHRMPAACQTIDDARLVASAPELLKACQAWMEFNRETKEENPCPDYGLRAELRKKAKELSAAAIAKATGRG